MFDGKAGGPSRFRILTAEEIEPFYNARRVHHATDQKSQYREW